MSADERARAFVDDQVELLRQRNVDGLLERHYHPDALLVTQQVSVRGHIALRAYFTQYVAALGDFEVNSIDLLSATDDAFLFEATVTSSLGRARVYDAFVLRDGRATHHFAGVMG
ncbi:MAG TPA: nuclear transport factor 2 family protein [Candidatus Dormibacteraeota bacterium]|nr:nuclear transport factor 2 family protein [Candidatus Dormibacteraeota bacterium]